MKYTPKDKQELILRSVIEDAVAEFGRDFPSRTIGNHHYIRRRHLEQFLYDFSHTLISKVENVPV